MKFDKILDYEGLAKWYIFANTPTYLYKHYRNDEGILAFSKAYSSSQLKKFFDDMISTKLENIDDFVTVYALIFALSFKEYSEVRDFFNSVDQYPLRWAKQIKQTYFAYHKPGEHKEIEGRKHYDTIDSSSKMVSDNSQSIDISK